MVKFGCNSQAMLKLISYNCQGVKSKLPIINKMCKESDILLLQETWLMPNECNYLKSVHKDFESFSLSSVKITNSVLVGRPYGGLSILWRRSLSPVCKLVHLEDDRLTGLIITFNNFELLIINVYLPYQQPDNLENYIEYLGKLESLISRYNCNGILIMGDLL